MKNFVGCYFSAQDGFGSDVFGGGVGPLAPMTNARHAQRQKSSSWCNAGYGLVVVANVQRDVQPRQELEAPVRISSSIDRHGGN